MTEQQQPPSSAEEDDQPPSPTAAQPPAGPLQSPASTLQPQPSPAAPAQEPSSGSPPAARRRGRPKGSKNRKTLLQEAVQRRELIPASLMPIPFIQPLLPLPTPVATPSQLSSQAAGQAGSEAAPQGRRRGRPPGSKNKKTLEREAEQQARLAALQQTAASHPSGLAGMGLQLLSQAPAQGRSRGRPPGSKNKVSLGTLAQTAASQPEAGGSPTADPDVPPEQAFYYPSPSTAQEADDGEPPSKRSRGRPKGSKNKATLLREAQAMSSQAGSSAPAGSTATLTPGTVDPASVEGAVVRRRRGRPKGSKNKKTLLREAATAAGLQPRAPAQPTLRLNPSSLDLLQRAASQAPTARALPAPALRPALSPPQGIGLGLPAYRPPTPATSGAAGRARLRPQLQGTTGAGINLNEPPPEESSGNSGPRGQRRSPISPRTMRPPPSAPEPEEESPEPEASV